jgi:uncharacterized membrane protein
MKFILILKKLKVKVQIKLADPEDRDSYLALIGLFVIHKVTSNTIKVKISNELLNRCIEIKKKLIELPDVIADPKIKTLKDLKDKPWCYEKLDSSGFFNQGIYKDMSSIRLSEGSGLTKGDRLIFEEFEPDKEDKGIDLGILVVEILFHYLRPISDFKKSLKPMDFELLTLVENYLDAENKESLIIALAKLSKLNPNKIWFF